MDKSDAFQGSPWYAVPSENWNCPTYWHEYYLELLTEANLWRRQGVVRRQADLLIRMLSQAGELPPSPSRTLLDAGCGIAFLPHVLAYWGFKVTAIDSCPQAIELSSRYEPTEEELAQCIPIWEPCEDVPDTLELVHDPARSLHRLRLFKSPGGSVSTTVSDWFAPDLLPGEFAVIHCRNSLRCSTKVYWRRSLRRFHELLSPGGALLLENVNAIGVRDEVNDLLEECKFLSPKAGAAREPTKKYVVSTWPTG